MDTPKARALGLDLEGNWPAAVRSGEVTPAMIGNIETALSKAVAEQDIDLAVLLHQPGPRRRVLARTAQLLFNAENMAEVAMLAAATEDDSPTLIRMHLRALERIGDLDRLRRTIRRLEKRTDLPEPVQAFLFQLRERHGFSLTSQDHLQFWGEVKDRLDEALPNLAAQHIEKGYTDRLVDLLLSIRGNPQDCREDFRRRLVWGHAVQNYLRFLARFNLEAVRQERAGVDMPEPDRRIVNLYRQVDELVLPYDSAPLEEARNEGRSIVVTLAHAGMSVLVQRPLKKIDLPDVLIAANAKSGQARPESVRFSARGNFQTDFIKLVQRVRRSQHLIRIFPDGARGGDRLDFDFLGRRIRLGQGAATLAFHARAATFFSGSRWENGRVRLILRRGPVAEPGMPREEFDRAFYDFYLGNLRDIALGPPEDMGGEGGLWKGLLLESQHLRGTAA